MGNRKFSISVHVLVLLARNKEEWISSDYLAESMNINPVLVRKELSNLRKHGFVISKEGKNGGCMLAKSADDIYLSEIYRMVGSHSVLGNSFGSPNPKCFVGRQINKHLNDLNMEAEKVMMDQLSGITITEFSSRFG